MTNLAMNLKDAVARYPDRVALRLEESALTEAVADARRRAQVMAAAAGAGEVRVLEVADPGLLSGGEAAQDSGVRFARAYGANGGEGIAVVPEDVTVEAAVQVRFEA